MRLGCAPSRCAPECHRLAAVRVHPAPYCATDLRAGTPAQASITSTTTRPWPCASLPHPGQPATQSQDSMSSNCIIWGASSRSSDGSPPNRRADHTDHNGRRRAAAGRVGHVEVLEDRGGRSPLIMTSTSTRNPDQHPLTHTQLGRACLVRLHTLRKRAEVKTHLSTNTLRNRHVSLALGTASSNVRSRRDESGVRFEPRT